MNQWRLRYGSTQHAAVLTGAPAVDIRSLRVGYPGATTPALCDVTCCIPVGVRMALVGPNGAGKSTLLKAIAGLLPVCCGAIRVYGQPAGRCHHRVAYVPQRSEINWTFPICVGKLVLTGRYVHLGWLRRPRQRDREIAEAMLARLGLTALANRHIGQLSGGQQQRVLLARALAQEADILLLDEPFTAVDVAMQERLSAILADLQQHGTTLLMATHNLGQHAAAFDGVLYLCGGRVCAPPQGNITPRRLEVP